MTAFLTTGFPAIGPCFKSVHSSAITCSVLPMPISCARRHPLWVEPEAPPRRKPTTHSYMNLTPSLWCGLSCWPMNGSTTTATLDLPSGKSTPALDSTIAPSLFASCRDCFSIAAPFKPPPRRCEAAAMPSRMEPTAGRNGAAFLTAGGARRAAGEGAVDPPASAAPDRNDSSDTESWISTSQLPISMVVPSTHVPALPLATILPVMSKSVVVGCWLIAMPSTQDLLLRFFALLRLA
mmetsp:Transcript_8448/g.38307  ORF Transcript_8448/g.38307 Transcript_8448/m.38307 type:complete len:237 (-) Transcript_8448:369-1079(-)